MGNPPQRPSNSPRWGVIVPGSLCRRRQWAGLFIYRFKVIAFHGTSEENAASIKREGFKYGSYFAFRIEDALAFGGNHVFAVEFSDNPSKWHGALDGPDGWQFWTQEHIPPSAIIELRNLP